jgi:DNA-binding HxlR family transcriptional regulator
MDKLTLKRRNSQSQDSGVAEGNAMWTYGQYCPLAHALEVLGDRWTMLIIRDLMKGIRHFNELERGLPGISRGLLSKRLQKLAQAGLIEKRQQVGRRSTEYHLTEAGHALEEAVYALWFWGKEWVFGEPSLEELNSPLLMWRMHKEVNTEYLPAERVVIQFDFYGAETSSYWLVLKPDDVSLCLTDPGFGIDVVVNADLVTFFKVWAHHMDYAEAIRDDRITVEGTPRQIDTFPKWFAWCTSPVQPGT